MSSQLQTVYRAWQQRGDRVADALIFPVLADALGCGRAHLEIEVLRRGYLHVLPLGDTALAAEEATRGRPPVRTRMSPSSERDRCRALGDKVCRQQPHKTVGRTHFKAVRLRGRRARRAEFSARPETRAGR